MSISGITKDLHASFRQPLARSGRLLILVSVILLAASCEMMPKRKPPASQPKPVVISKPPVTTPLQPVETSTGLIDPGNHEQEKGKVKQSLSKNTRDSLPAAEVGYYMDVLQGRVKQQIGKSKGIGIARSNDRIVIVMTGAAGFEAGNNQVTPGIRAFLAPLSKVLVEYRMTLVSVRIRAESTAGKVGNPQLTEQRALAVARYLTDAGVSSKRMVVVGAGKNNVASSSVNANGRERIEIQVEPIIRAAGG